MTLKEWGPWINRIGILFTFLAGFLVSPELLGRKRIDAWKRKMENIAKRFGPQVHGLIAESADPSKKFDQGEQQSLWFGITETLIGIVLPGAFALMLWGGIYFSIKRSIW